MVLHYDHSQQFQNFSLVRLFGGNDHELTPFSTQDFGICLGITPYVYLVCHTYQNDLFGQENPMHWSVLPV